MAVVSPKVAQKLVLASLGVGNVSVERVASQSIHAVQCDVALGDAEKKKKKKKKKTCTAFFSLKKALCQLCPCCSSLEAL